MAAIIIKRQTLKSSQRLWNWSQVFQRSWWQRRNVWFSSEVMTLFLWIIMTDFLKSAKFSASPSLISSPCLKYQKEYVCVSLDTFSLKLEDIFIWSQRISHQYKTSLWWNNECYGLSNCLINKNDFLFQSLLKFFSILFLIEQSEKKLTPSWQRLNHSI